MNSKVTDFDREIAKTLKSLRLDCGHSQATVARFLEMRYQSYQDLEAGRISFRASTLHRLAQFYGVDYSTLVNDEARSTPAFPTAPQLGQIAAMFVEMPDRFANMVVREVASMKRQA